MRLRIKSLRFWPQTGRAALHDRRGKRQRRASCHQQRAGPRRSWFDDKHLDFRIVVDLAR